MSGLPIEVRNGPPVEVPRPEPSRSRPAALPPHDVGAEEATIAALLLDPDALDDVRELVAPADFYREPNGWVLAAALALADRGEEITIVTVAHELERAGLLDLAGGEPALVELAGRYFTAEGVQAHARIVARDALYRRLISAAHNITVLGYRGGPDADAVLSTAARLIEGVESREQSGAWVTLGDVLRAWDDTPEARGMSSGYPAIDAITGGLRRGQITLIGARTDNGKSALMAGLAVRQAMAGVPVAYLPLEDSRDEIAIRMADHIAGVSRSYIERSGLGAGALEAWEDAADRADALPVQLPEHGRTPGDIDGLCALVVAAARRGGAANVIIDHLDALPMLRERGQNTAGAYADIMRRLKSLAVRLDVHLTVASQVNRDAAYAAESENPPRMFRLRESGAKEEAAQTVIMIGLEPQPELGGDADQQPLRAYVEKVKGYPGGRYVSNRYGQTALYLDRRAGAVYEHGTDDLGAPPPPRAEQAALADAAFAAELAP